MRVPVYKAAVANSLLCADADMPEITGTMLKWKEEKAT